MVQEKNLSPLLDLVMEHVKPTNLDKTKPFAMLSTLLYADSFLGRSLVGKIAQGTAKANQQIKAINLNGEKVDEGRLTKYLDMKVLKSSNSNRRSRRHCDYCRFRKS